MSDGQVNPDPSLPSPPASDGPPVPVPLRPSRRFDEVSAQVVAYLNGTTELNVWAVTRVSRSTQVFLTSTGPTEDIPVEVGGRVPFDHTMCRQMASGAADRIAPDLRADPAYADAVAHTDAAGFAIRSYIGTPIVRPDGTLFGTLCGFGSQTQSDALTRLEPLLDLLTALLSAVLETDLIATAAAREVERARRDSEVDALTGLLNRRGWDRFISHEQARIRRFGDPVSVLYLDLDRLKRVNDAHGHGAGDEYIRRAATVLSAHTRATDVVARLGGDEFGVIAVNATADDAAVLAQRLEDHLAAAGVQGSIGHAAVDIVDGFEAAQQAADTMMYERKRRRRPVS